MIAEGFDPFKSQARPWPIFEESYREILQEKILRAYWNEEIAYSTMTEFRERLNSQLFIDMPYYNQRYRSTLMKFDPFVNFVLNQDDTTRELRDRLTTQDKQVDTSGETSGLSSGESSEDGTSQSRTNYDQDRDYRQTVEAVAETNKIFNDTPEGVTDFRTLDYATDVTNEDGKQDTFTEGSEDISGSSTTNGTTGKTGSTLGETSSDYMSVVIDVMNGTFNERLNTFNYRRSTGINRKTLSEAMNEFRSTFINVDREIVDSLWVHFNTVIPL